MSSQFMGALRHFRTVVIGFGILFSLPGLALAHEGHDHGAPDPAATTTASPRVALHSDAYELVGVLSVDRLGLYLDRFATNEPVTDAKIAVTVGGDEELQAEPRPDGTYDIRSLKFLGEGPLELIFSVTHHTGDDLLIGSLRLPLRPAAAPASPARPSPLQALQSLPDIRVGTVEVPMPYAIAGASLALGFLLGLALRSRSRLVPATGLGLILVLATTAFALSHEGHDHGSETKAALPAGDTPRRLPDGTLFVPKPTQRLLEVRTTVTKPEAAAKATTIVGRVIADPNRGGVVQSINGGRIVPTENGLPRVGQTVSKGDVLAQVELPLPQADRTTIAERSGEIEQQIALAETKLKRIRGLAERGITPQSQIVDAETELEGLRRRREIVRSTRIEPEVLRASADGVIAAVRVAPGQVVQAQDLLFQIVDPKGLWIEALAYGEVDPAKVTSASARTADGTPLKLFFQGFSRALQQQATVVQFAVEDPPPALQVGQPVTVVVQNGATVSGILLPREAVVRGGSGEALVWRHTDPERFEARPVRTEPFDATRVVIRAGVSEGDRVVTRGAELVNQIR